MPTLNQKKAHDALQEAVAACGGKWRDIEFHGCIPEHEQMDTPKGRLVLLARARVFAHQAGVKVSRVAGATVAEKARNVADCIEDQCVAELGVSAWTGKPVRAAKRGRSSIKTQAPAPTESMDRPTRKLSPAQQRMILRVYATEYEMTPGGSRAAALSASAWWRTATSLHQLGLITKHPAGGAALIRLSPAGLEAAAALQPQKTPTKA